MRIYNLHFTVDGVWVVQHLLLVIYYCTVYSSTVIDLDVRRMPPVNVNTTFRLHTIKWSIGKRRESGFALFNDQLRYNHISLLFKTIGLLEIDVNMIRKNQILWNINVNSAEGDLNHCLK